MVTSSEGKTKTKASNIISEALKKGQKTLSEYQSKLLLAEYEIPVVPEKLVSSSKDACDAAEEIGYPVVLKACGPDISHKTERGLVLVGLKRPEEVKEAFQNITERLQNDEWEGILVQSMVKGERELVIGLVRDPQFGPCVMFGLGGIFTEILRDVSFRVAPIEKEDALSMMQEIRAKAILGPVRGMPPADTEILAKALVELGRIGVEHENVSEIDVNPMIIGPQGMPCAVDALVVLGEKQASM